MDDDADVRAYVRDVLEMTGLTVLEAADARTALAIAADGPSPIDLLLTDVEMPGIDGIELARRVRVLRPETRVQYMSGSDPDVLATRGLSAADLIAKPVGVGVLMDRVGHGLGADLALGASGRGAAAGSA